MKIAVIGTGYVGLVTGACLANVGHCVWCLDTDTAKIENLRKGILPIYEPGLEPIVERCLEDETLKVTTDALEAISASDIIFIAVGTPPGEDGYADLKYVLQVAQTLGDLMEEPKIFVDKSTVPVGTAEKVRSTIQEQLDARGKDIDFEVCSNPEFLKEGCAVDDFNKPARIIIGTESDNVQQKMRELYAPFNRSRDKLIFMDIRSAELTKYAANAMLATKISFINEISHIAEKVGADIEAVRTGIGSDPRIGHQFIYPGAGYGGSCFPKDVQALAQIAASVDVDPIMLNAVQQTNERQKQTLFDKLLHGLGGSVEGKQIAIWGLAFKPNTDDMRMAPSLVIIDQAIAAGGTVVGFDPVAGEEAAAIYSNQPAFSTVATKEEAIEGADAIVICTEWNHFKTIDFESIRNSLKTPLIIDGRNVLDANQAVANGFTYYSIGRTPRHPSGSTES